MENDGWQLNNNNEKFLDFNGGTMENDELQLNIDNDQVFYFMPGTMENNGQQLLNNNNEQVPDIMGDDTDLNYSEFDMDVLLGTDDHHVGSNQRGDDGDRHSASGPPPPKRSKRFSVRQVQELEAMFKACTHPGFEVRQEIGERIGLDQRQVKFWFQNKRSQQKLKACGDENKEMLEENTKLRAENTELKQLLVNPQCFGCRNPIGAKQKESEKWLLLSENARLKDELLRSKANLNSASIRGSGQHPSAMSSQHPASASAPPNNQQVTLVAHADRALKEFVMLATMGQPMWLPTVDGEVLSDKEYALHTSPGMLGLCPRGYILEATRETDMIQGTAIDIVNVLTDVAQWSGMFSNIVAYVRSSNVISSRGSSSSRDGLIQLIDADFWVQSSRLPIRSVKFLRFSKMMENRTWAMVDVSVPGNHGFDQESSGASYMGYRLLPSGCLLEDMSGGFCKVTWVVHSEYKEATVPAHFRQFFHSGQAFGARRWLKSLQRQCECMAVLLHSSNVPSSSSSSSSAGATISALGKRSVLELAQRMTSSFYTAVSGPITVAATNIVDKLCVSNGTTATMRLEAAVRMVTWNCADVIPGEPSIAVMSATTTVWLPGTPPLRVFEYLCNLQRRGEWDFFGREVQEMVEYIPTSSRLHGNGVSILRPTTAIPDGSHETNTNMLILQQTSTDMSGSMVVYSLIQENLMRRIMGGANNNIFVVPSGFAILPDGHGKAHCTAASSSSSAPIGHNNGSGSLLTVAFQEMLSRGNNLAAGTFDNAGQKLCHAIMKIKNAIGANNVIPV